MRVVLVLALVSLAAASATANPRSRGYSTRSRADSARRAAPEVGAVRETPPAQRREIQRRPEPAQRRAVAPARDELADFTMPPLWTDVRIKIYEQLPSGGADLGFSYTLMPMAITGASETTAPGLGISGTF